MIFLANSLGLPDPATVISQAVAYIDPEVRTFVLALGAIAAFKVLVFGRK